MARTVTDVMTSQPTALDAGESVPDAARAMRDGNIGDVLVTQGGSLVGIPARPWRFRKEPPPARKGRRAPGAFTDIFGIADFLAMAAGGPGAPQDGSHAPRRGAPGTRIPIR